MEHPLGTNDVGHDFLSKVVIGARPTIIAGGLGGILLISIGMTIGVTAGYVGGRVDDILMRFTDLAYGVPLLPFALVLIGLLGVGFIESVVVIGLVLWRESARVIRSQVLQMKERPYIMAAKGTGASTLRIIFKHVIPNVAPMAILFFSIGVGYTIILQAGLSFLGVSSPFIPSWGIIIRNAFDSGQILNSWWWALSPGVMLGLTVMCTFMFGRSYERVVGGSDTGDEALVG